jgi:hypothetical protein
VYLAAAIDKLLISRKRRPKTETDEELSDVLGTPKVKLIGRQQSRPAQPDPAEADSARQVVSTHTLRRMSRSLLGDAERAALAEAAADTKEAAEFAQARQSENRLGSAAEH